MSFWDELKELIYKPVRQDSRNFKKLGQMWNIPYLEQEGERNIRNPGRAVGKAAATAATWYLGGLLGGTGGATGAAATNTAGTAASAAANAFPAALSSMPVSEIAQLATQSPELASTLMQSVQTAAPEVTKSSLDIGAKGLLNYGKDALGSAQGFFSNLSSRAGEGLNTLMDGSVPAGLPGTMESGLIDSGYTPSSLKFAFQNASESTPLSQNLVNYGQQGLRNFTRGSGNKMADEMAVKLGMNMMSPQQQQQAPMPAPPRQQAPQEPLPMPYGGFRNSLDGPPPGMTREEWERMKRMRQGLLGRA